MKLAALMVLTPDLAEARRFYEGVLGFGVISSSDERLVLEHAGAMFQVLRCEAPAPPIRHGHDAASVFVFEVADLDRTMAELKAKGVSFIHERPAENPLGRYAAFHAPGGNIHEVFEPRSGELQSAALRVGAEHAGADRRDHGDGDHGRRGGR